MPPQATYLKRLNMLPKDTHIIRVAKNEVVQLIIQNHPALNGVRYSLTHSRPHPQPPPTLLIVNNIPGTFTAILFGYLDMGMMAMMRVYMRAASTRTIPSYVTPPLCIPTNGL